MDTLTLLLGAALGVAGILLIYWSAARWSVRKRVRRGAKLRLSTMVGENLSASGSAT